MKYYRVVIRPKAEWDKNDESNVTLGIMEYRFGIGDQAGQQDPYVIVSETLSSLHLTLFVDYELEEVQENEDPGNTFEDWLDEQPFGGPSKTPGKRIITDSTIRLMRSSWDAGAAAESRLNAIRAERQEQGERDQAEKELLGERWRGDIRG